MRKISLFLFTLAFTGCRAPGDVYNITEEGDVYEGDTINNYYGDENDTAAPIDETDSDLEEAIYTSQWDTVILLSQGEYEAGPGDELFLGTSILNAKAGGLSTLESLSYQVYWSSDKQTWWSANSVNEAPLHSCKLDWYFPAGSRVNGVEGHVSNGLITFDLNVQMDSEAEHDEIQVRDFAYPKIYCVVNNDLSETSSSYFKIELLHLKASNAAGPAYWYEESRNGNPPNRYFHLTE